MIATGNDHACSLNAAGAVRCWGGNIYGQLGTGTLISSAEPQPVLGLDSGVAALSLGGNQSCALLDTGGVRCWGANYVSQLGIGSVTDSESLPKPVVGLSSGVTAIAIGNTHGCALLSTTGVKCWGNTYTGDGTSAQRSSPVDVLGLTSGVTAIASGFSGSCAILSGGALKCWGARVGDGTTTNRPSPTDVTGLNNGVMAVTVGTSVRCALLTGGAVQCWGTNTYGAVGDGTTVQRLLPTPVTALAGNALSIKAGGVHTCALLQGGAVQCWGRNNYGGVGDGSTTDRSSPVAVVGQLTGVSSVALGNWFSCAMTTGGGVRCWGDNRFGQVGSGVPGWAATAQAIVSLGTAASAVNVGGFFACATTTGGALRCWGSNGTNGAMGDGTIGGIRTAPSADVSGFSSGTAYVSMGASHGCAVTAGGGLKCWGENSLGQLGDGTKVTRPTPVDVVGLTSGVAAVSAINRGVCARTTAGAAKCWGDNYYGQAGDGSTTGFGDTRTSPVAVVGLSTNVSDISAGGDSACAVIAPAGAVKCWGRNSNGQVGDGTTTDRLAPTDVVGLSSGVASVHVGYGFACARLTTNGVKCWGTYALGNGTFAASLTPVDPVGLSTGVLQVATSFSNACARMSDGTVKCWGGNYEGAVGDGTLIDRAVPTPVVGLLAPAVSISVGATSACALLATGAIQCWGGNQTAQMGNGTFGFTTAPDRYVVSPSLSQPLAVADATTVKPETDGAMILRYLSGAVGASITSGIGTSGALRTDPTQVNAYLETIRPLLDIDGNGQFSPLSDGLLLVRYMSGLRNDALVAGAVGAGATRDTAAIQAYLATLLP
jgi:alpha-tubulin suppressor-like RCC1 family protein